jgi:hypothetical protein
VLDVQDTGVILNCEVLFKYCIKVIVPDRRSRSLEVVVVRRINNLGTGNLEWGGSGEN